jgi:ribonuclease VapC
MVVDTSALMAIFLLEPEAERFAHAILEAPKAAISAANLLEASIILDARIGSQDSSELDEFVANVGLEIEPVTTDQVRIARLAYRTYGRGNHPAGLNFGDCFAYALAKTTGLPLLFKGGDFAQTDVARAVG